MFFSVDLFNNPPVFFTVFSLDSAIRIIVVLDLFVEHFQQLVLILLFLLVSRTSIKYESITDHMVQILSVIFSLTLGFVV